MTTRGKVATIESRTSGQASRPNSGLGRGLDGILGDSFVAEADSGLLQLLGRYHVEGVREIRQFVADTAVGAVAGKFGAEAVWLASVGVDGVPDLVAAHLPPSWSHTSSTSFEIVGRLWQSLVGDSGCVQHQIDDVHIWNCCLRSGASVFSVALVRSEPIGIDEQQTLERFLRSVSVAVGGNGAELPGVDVSVSVQQGAKTAIADVEIAVAGASRHKRREASSAPLATASAAAALCEVPCKVAYAGQVSLDRHSVNMVVVLDEAEAPLIGLSVVPSADLAGPARAVFSCLAGVSGTSPLPQIGNE